MKLIICGNGFDLNHRLQTGYKCYRCYLQDVAPDVLRKFEELPWGHKQVGENKWRDIEKSLELDVDDLLSTVAQYEINVPPENVCECKTDMDDRLRFIHLFTGELFYQWLSDVDTSKARAKSELSKCFEDALFVNFNYTNTLECVYGVAPEKILHIHGALADVNVQNCFGQDILPRFSTIEEAECYDKPLLESDKWNSNIIRNIIQFGAPREWEQISRKLNDAFRDQERDIYEELSEVLPKTIKTLSKNLPSLQSFLLGKTIDEIIIMGHSLNGPDDFYYEKCLIPLYKDKKWTFYWHRGYEDPLSGKREIEKFCQKHKITPNFCEW